MAEPWRKAAVNEEHDGESDCQHVPDKTVDAHKIHERVEIPVGSYERRECAWHECDKIDLTEEGTEFVLTWKKSDDQVCVDGKTAEVQRQVTDRHVTECGKS